MWNDDVRRSRWEWDCFMKVQVIMLDFGRKEPKGKSIRISPKVPGGERALIKPGTIWTHHTWGKFRWEQAILKIPSELGDEPFIYTLMTHASWVVITQRYIYCNMRFHHSHQWEAHIWSSFWYMITYISLEQENYTPYLEDSFLNDRWDFFSVGWIIIP